MPASLNTISRHPAVPVDFGTSAPLPPGELTFSGLVTHRDGYGLMPRSKAGVKEIRMLEIRVRKDTRYIGDGCRSIVPAQ